MKKQLSTLFCVGCLALTPLASQTNPDLLVYEGFNYAEMNTIWCLNSQGIGWTGAWERVQGDDAIIRADNLEIPGMNLDPGNHCAIDFIRAGVRYNRPIDEIADDGQTVWVSVIMDFKPDPHPNNVGNITLIKDGNQVFTFGRKFGNGRIGTVWPGSTSYNTDISTEGLKWMVLKIRFSGDSGQEQAWLWIDPDPQSVPLESTADLIMPQAGMPALRINSGFDGVQLKVEGTPPLRVSYDEFRIGRSFAAISPALTSQNEISSAPIGLQLFPNPTQDEIGFEFVLPQVQALGFSLFDTAGRQVFRQADQRFPEGYTRGSLNITAQDLAPGLYYLQVQGGRYLETKRIIIN
ncbi:MAG: T9SS type A sorting domain-containing protein [Bacteroidota bacterium]